LNSGEHVEDFHMTIHNLYELKNRGLVVIGVIHQGSVSAGDMVQIALEGHSIKARVSSIPIVAPSLDAINNKTQLFFKDISLDSELSWVGALVTKSTER